MSTWIKVIISLTASLTLISCSEETPANTVTGFIRADYVYAAPVSSGRLIDLNVAEGDFVEKGDLLFVLDNVQQTAQLAQMRAQLSQADAVAANLGIGARPEEIDALRAQLKDAKSQFAIADENFIREQSLVAAGAVATARVDQLEAVRDSAQARVEAAEKAIAVARLPARTEEQRAARAAVDAAQAFVDQAEWALEQRTVYAEQAGRVELVLRRAGEITGPTAPALALLPPDRHQLRFYVPQAQLPTLSLGTTVRISADGTPETEEATITYISAEAEFTPPVIYSNDMRDKLVFAVDARLAPDSQLPPGLPVDVILP